VTAPAPPPRRSARRQSNRAPWREDPVPLGEALQQVVGRLGVGRVATVATVFGSWDELVGPALAAHVRPVRLDKGTLTVGVDHPAWATEVRRIAPELLLRLAGACGGSEALQRIEVRVRSGH